MSWFNASKPALRRRPLAAVVAGLVLVACSVDERLLVNGRSQGGAGLSGGAGRPSIVAGSSNPGGGGDADVSPNGGVGSVTDSFAGSGGEGSGDSPSVGDGGGEASVGSTGGAPGGSPDNSPGGAYDYGAGGCGDLDHNGVQDCKETVLSNARFDHDEAGWQAEPSTARIWDPRNARPDQTSGALAVTNGLIYAGEGMTLGGSRQCQPTVGGKKYSVGARAFIPEGQGEVAAGISISFYGIEGCSDYFLSAAPPIMMIAGPNAWGLIKGTVAAPLAAHSAYIRLVTVKPFKQAPTKVLFDDVLVREE